MIITEIERHLTEYSRISSENKVKFEKLRAAKTSPSSAKSDSLNSSASRLNCSAACLVSPMLSSFLALRSWFSGVISSTPLSSAMRSASSTTPRRLRSPGRDSELSSSRWSASLSSALCEKAGRGRAPW